MNRSQERAMFARLKKNGFTKRDLKWPYPNDMSKIPKNYQKRVDRYQEVKQKILLPIKRDRYDKLYFYEETDPEKLKNGEYKYVITNGAFAHKAFRTKEGLDEWLKDTGVKLEGDSNAIDKNGMMTKGKPYRIVGGYEEVSLSGSIDQLKEFAKEHHLRPVEVLKNGKYQRGFVHEDKRNGNTIYYMNINYPFEELPYRHK